MKSSLKEREETHRKMEILQKEYDDLQYALKVLLETGTVIPPELDEHINDVLSTHISLDLIVFLK